MNMLVSRMEDLVGPSPLKFPLSYQDHRLKYRLGGSKSYLGDYP